MEARVWSSQVARRGVEPAWNLRIARDVLLVLTLYDVCSCAVG
jgi:hypothetical protein